MSAFDRVQRMSEPSAISKWAAIIFGFVFTMELGYLAATGQIELLILVAVWVMACLVIVFVRDYWWAPALIVTALTLTTFAAGFACTGLEVGMVILALTFPVKLAMKTLWPAKPRMEPGMLYWALLTFVAVHGVVILFYNKMEGVPQLKNIVKAYYEAIAPLVLYGMLVRYCKSRTVFPTCVTLFVIWTFTTIVAIPVMLFDVEILRMTALQLKFDFLDSNSANGLLRTAGPFIFIGALAYWPAARSSIGRIFLGFIAVLGMVEVLLSAGRTVTASCFLAAVFFAVVRKQLWLALPATLVVAMLAGVCTLKPNLMYAFPEPIQRALAPLNFSDQKTEVQEATGESDRWHQELRTSSLTYWNQDTTSFFFGHGYKSWDPSIMFTSHAGVNADFDTLKSHAIEMGLTENMFSSVTNIFGLAGLVLYGAFLVQLACRLWKARGLCPGGSPERAVCEFSFVILTTSVVLAPFNGGVPGINLIYWGLGLFAARPYIGLPEPAPAAPIPAYDLSRRVVRVAPGGSLRGDPLAAFAKRQSGHFKRTGVGGG